MRVKWLLVLVVAVSLVGLTGPGCGSTPATKAYQVAGTTDESVEVVMAGWAAWVKAGKATIAQEITVRSAYRKYQAAMLVVCDAGAAWSAAEGTNSTGATGLSAAFQQAVANAADALADVKNLVAQFTGKK